MNKAGPKIMGWQSFTLGVGYLKYLKAQVKDVVLKNKGEIQYCGAERQGKELKVGGQVVQGLVRALDFTLECEEKPLEGFEQNGHSEGSQSLLSACCVPGVFLFSKRLWSAGYLRPYSFLFILFIYLFFIDLIHF